MEDMKKLFQTNKKPCLAFFKDSFTPTHLLLSAWDYSTFSQDKSPLFSTTVPFRKLQAALPPK